MPALRLHKEPHHRRAKRRARLRRLSRRNHNRDQHRVAAPQQPSQIQIRRSPLRRPAVARADKLVPRQVARPQQRRAAIRTPARLQPAARCLEARAQALPPAPAAKQAASQPTAADKARPRARPINLIRVRARHPAPALLLRLRAPALLRHP